MGLFLLETDQGGQCLLCRHEGDYLTELSGGSHLDPGQELESLAVLQLHLLRPIRERVAMAGEVVQGR